MMLSLHAAFSITSGAALGGAKIARHVQNAKIIDQATKATTEPNVQPIGYDQYVGTVYAGGAFLWPYAKLELRVFGLRNYDREAEEMKNTWQGGGELSLLFRISPELALGLVGGAFVESFKDHFRLKDDKDAPLTVDAREHKLWPPRYFGGIRAAYFITPRWALEVTGTYSFSWPYQEIKGKTGDNRDFSMEYKYVTKKLMIGFAYHFLVK